jgi:hypothetical protein
MTTISIILLTLIVTPVIYTCLDDLQSLRVGKVLKLPDWFWERMRWIPGRVARPSAEVPARSPFERPTMAD